MNVDSGRNPSSVLVGSSQLSPLNQFAAQQQSLYSPNQVDNQMIYRDYAAAAASALYANASNQAAANAYLSPAHAKQANGANGGLFAANTTNPALGAINIPVPPPAHHQSSSAAHHHSSIPSGSLNLNAAAAAVASHGSYSAYSHGLVQGGNPLPAHIQQPLAHTYPQLHGATGSNLTGPSAISAIQFSQSNYPANYGPIQPLASAGKGPQYPNLYQFFSE